MTDFGCSIRHGDARDVVATLARNSIDAAAMDPPYGIEFLGRGWDHPDSAAFDPAFWAAVLEAMKPGAFLAAFCATRTYHRLAVAIEDGGFDIRDQIAWTYGEGFPKGPKLAPGVGTVLKPAWEPICLARKPLDGTVHQNFALWGTGGLNIDDCRVEAPEGVRTFERLGPAGMDAEKRQRSYNMGGIAVGSGTIRPGGRFPANLIHDGSDGVVALFPDSISSGGSGVASRKAANPMFTNKGGLPDLGANAGGLGDSGSAARFFYSAKAGPTDRLGSDHPTVKPVDLMQWLVRLVTPRGADRVVLDAFAGTGTTGEAAWREGRRSILVERDEQSIADIHRRFEFALTSEQRRRVAGTKQKGVDDLPMFGGS